MEGSERANHTPKVTQQVIHGSVQLSRVSSLLILARQSPPSPLPPAAPSFPGNLSEWLEQTQGQVHLCLLHSSQGVQRGAAGGRASCENLPLRDRASKRVTGSSEPSVEGQGAKGKMDIVGSRQESSPPDLGAVQSQVQCAGIEPQHPPPVSSCKVAW